MDFLIFLQGNPRDQSCERASSPVHVWVTAHSPLAGCRPADGAARVSKEPPAPWSPQTFVLRRSQNKHIECVHEAKTG